MKLLNYLKKNKEFSFIIFTVLAIFYILLNKNREGFLGGIFNPLNSSSQKINDQQSGVQISSDAGQEIVNTQYKTQQITNKIIKCFGQKNSLVGCGIKNLSDMGNDQVTKLENNFKNLGNEYNSKLKNGILTLTPHCMVGGPAAPLACAPSFSIPINPGEIDEIPDSKIPDDKIPPHKNLPESPGYGLHMPNYLEHKNKNEPKPHMTKNNTTHNKNK